MQAPPQFSPDGLFWWDGVRWVPRGAMPRPPVAQPAPPPPPPPPLPPGYPPVAPAFAFRPSPGLRIVLMVALAVEVGLSGLLSFVFLGSTIGGAQDNPALGYLIGVAFGGLFVISLAALVGVAVRTVWSIWAAIASGILISFTAVGLLVGIPILVCAARLELASHQRGGAG